MQSAAKKQGKLVHKFILSIGLCIFVFITFQIFYLYNEVKSKISQLYQASCSEIVVAIAAQISEWNEIFINDLRYLTEQKVVKNGNIDEIHTWIEEHGDFPNPEFGMTLFADINGNTTVFNSSASANISDRNYFKNFINKKPAKFTTAPVKEQAYERYMYFCAKTAYNSQNIPIGFFANGVYLDNLIEICNNIKLGNNAHSVILDGDGRVISHYNKDYIMKVNYLTDPEGADNKGLQNLARKMVAGETSSSWIREDKVDYFAAFAPVPGTDWSIALEIPKLQINKIANVLSLTIFVFGIIMALAITVVVVFLFSKITKPLNKFEHAMLEIASGEADFTKRINIDRNDEIGRLAASFNMFMERSQNIILTIKQSEQRLSEIESEAAQKLVDTKDAIKQLSYNIDNIETQEKNQSGAVDETAGAVEEITQNIDSLERMIQTTAAGMTQASAAIEQMISNINSINTSVEKMSADFNKLQKDAHIGIEKQHAVNETVISISEQSAMLMNANNAIANIANQTNMLAMNAAIEAAHAGDAGKGFSVVADEIRKLSETSAEQSHTIGDELKKITGSISSVVKMSDDSAKTFSSVSKRIEQTDNVINQIHNAMEEQKDGSTQILEALRAVNDNTSELKVAATEMAAGNKTILESMKSLRDVTLTINNSIEKMAVETEHLQEIEKRLSEMLEDMSASVKQIGEEIDQFQV